MLTILEEMRQLAILQREARGDALPQSDKAKVVEAVASALIDSRVKDPKQRDAIIKAISERLEQREKAGKVPAVPLYHKQAPSTQQQPERTRPRAERSEAQQR